MFLAVFQTLEKLKTPARFQTKKDVFIKTFGGGDMQHAQNVLLKNLFLYLALHPAVCIETVGVYICILIALVKTGDGVGALQPGVRGLELSRPLFRTFLLRL